MTGVIWSSEQAAALASVFNALNQSGIPWLVLRNYEGLPLKNRSKDIDLGIEKNYINDAAVIISDTLKPHGFNRVFTTNFLNMRCSTYFKVLGDKVLSIKIDLMDGFVWRGAHIFEFSQLYASRIPYSNFFIPNHVDDGVMLWIKPLMIGAGVKDRYVEDILSANANDPNQYRKQLSRTVGDVIGLKLWSFAEQGRLHEAVPLKRSVSWAAWLQAVARHGLSKTLVAGMEHLYLEVARRAQRSPASLLAVVGPDGVGKTTFINLLQQELARVMVKDLDSIQVLHFRPNILPNIKELISGKNYDASTEEFSKPHRAAPASPPSSLARLVYYWADYLLGYWLVNRRKCARGTVMIFDRYFYDFIVDPRRSRINLPAWVRKFFLRLTPQPDLVFFLDCDPDIVYTRKQELERDEIERQLTEYRKLASKFPNRFIRLNAQQLPEVICRQALCEIVRRSFTQL